MKMRGGGPPVGLSFPNLKDLSVCTQEGDPPIGKERGTLGVGTGPTPPHQAPNQEGGTEEQEQGADPMEHLFGMNKNFCLECALIPCQCDLMHLERKIEMIELKEKISTLQGELRNKEKRLVHAKPETKPYKGEDQQNSRKRKAESDQEQEEQVRPEKRLTRKNTARNSSLRRQEQASNKELGQLLQHHLEQGDDGAADHVEPLLTVPLHTNCGGAAVDSETEAADHVEPLLTAPLHTHCGGVAVESGTDNKKELNHPAHPERDDLCEVVAEVAEHDPVHPKPRHLEPDHCEPQGDAPQRVLDHYKLENNSPDHPEPSAAREEPGPGSGALSLSLDKREIPPDQPTPLLPCARGSQSLSLEEVVPEHHEVVPDLTEPLDVPCEAGRTPTDHPEHRGDGVPIEKLVCKPQPPQEQHHELVPGHKLHHQEVVLSKQSEIRKSRLSSSQSTNQLCTSSPSEQQCTLRTCTATQLQPPPPSRTSSTRVGGGPISVQKTIIEKITKKTDDPEVHRFAKKSFIDLWTTTLTQQDPKKEGGGGQLPETTANIR